MADGAVATTTANGSLGDAGEALDTMAVRHIELPAEIVYDRSRLHGAGSGGNGAPPPEIGTVVGSMADKYGRKNAALTYVVTYIASCVTKHWSDYGVLMLGRFFGGIATSLLFTAFESWLVSEHFKRGYEAEWLDKTFAKAIFLGNGLVSIVSGLLANYLVTDMSLGPVAPFDAAAVFLAIGGVVIFFTWSENKAAKAKIPAARGFDPQQEAEHG